MQRSAGSLVGRRSPGFAPGCQFLIAQLHTEGVLGRVLGVLGNQPGAPALKPGEIYQWKLWADKGTQENSFVENLISSSEDLRGIFQVPEISAD